MLVAALAGCSGPVGPYRDGEPLAVGDSVAYELHTHCGIGEVRIGAAYFATPELLSDGNGNPPPGWGNPVQKGELTLVSADEARFADEAGHQITLVIRPGATSYRASCT